MTDQSAIVKKDQVAIDAIEAVIATGDLARLSPEQRVNFYTQTCRSLGLNPLTKPFEYLNLSGRLVLYARKDATEQLRKIDGVSITGLERETVNDVYVVTARAQTKDGRTDSSIGAVNIAGLKGDAIANAMMKAETKAKRRVTLSICGLGFLDETEIETIPNARIVNMDATNDGGKAVTGAIIKELGYEPEPETPAHPASLASLMTLEMAMSETSSTGEKYSTMTDIQLHNRLRGIAQGLAKPDVTPDYREELLRKQDAIKVILADRAKAA